MGHYFLDIKYLYIIYRVRLAPNKFLSHKIENKVWLIFFLNNIHKDEEKNHSMNRPLRR